MEKSVMALVVVGATGVNAILLVNTLTLPDAVAEPATTSLTTTTIERISAALKPGSPALSKSALVNLNFLSVLFNPVKRTVTFLAFTPVPDVNSIFKEVVPVTLKPSTIPLVAS